MLDPNPLVFVAMTPCRVVDTRASQGFPPAFGPPSLVAGASRTFPVQSSASCPIPAAAQAYSFNVTAVPAGPSGFITAYPTTWDESVALANGALAYLEKPVDSSVILEKVREAIGTT